MDVSLSLDCKDASDGVDYSLEWWLHLQYLEKVGGGGAPTGVHVYVTINELILIGCCSGESTSTIG